MSSRWGQILARSSVALAVAVATLMMGPPAMSSPRPPSLPPAPLPGPASLSTGLVDDSLFAQAPEAIRAAWFPRAHAVGSTSVRLGLSWSLIAPAQPAPGFNPSNPGDPQYDWSSVDASVQDLVAHHQTVVLGARSAPSWAEGPGMPANLQFSGIWMPDPRAYGLFAHALALRYSGHFRAGGRLLPHVTYFQAWNEPNLPRYLMPQWERNGNGPWMPTSPVIYRRLLNAFYAGVKSVDPHDTVLAAGLAPYGDPPATAGGRMYPVTFLKQMLCLTPSLRKSRPCPAPAHFDALDHHPYGLTPTAKAHSPDNVGVPDLAKIWRVLHAAQRLNLALPAGPKSLWVTELAWSDVPPSPPSPASVALQARFLALGFYELWRQGVSHIFWFQLRDPPGQPNSFAGTGLYFVSGVAKPSAASFRFPFIAIPARHKKLTIWGLAPTPGQVLIEKRVRGRWRPVLSLRTSRGGIFYANYRLGSHLQLRAVEGAAVSPVWATNGPM